jgi:predicted Zn-dependent protease
MNVEPANTLLAEGEAQKLLKSVLERCPERAEAIYLESDEALTRFANNHVHQNVRSRRRSVMLRLFLGKRSGVASTSRLDTQALDDLVQRARDMAELSPENPDFGDLPMPAPIQPLKGYVDATAECSPEERAEAVLRVVDPVKKVDMVVAGALSTGSNLVSVANTSGVFAYFPSTASNFTCTVMAEDSSGWVDVHARDWRKLDTGALGLKAIEKARVSAHPVSVPAGKYTVVLEENAVAELVAFLGWTGFGAQSYQEGHSFLNGRLGQKITGERISIVDDAFDARTLGMPFDYEGVPKRRTSLIENGVAKGLVYDSISAKRDAVASTGHALPPPNPEGPLPYDLIVGTGEHSLDEMIAATERGILVTRFWYNRVVDPRNTVITGMTRDGTFLIENGRVTGGVRNLRYNESVLDVLARAERIGKTALPTVFDYTRNCVVAPAMQVREFNFTGVTEF